MGHPTRQQRRKNTRKFNKSVTQEGKSLLGQKLMDEESKKNLEKYKLSNQYPAVMPFCIVFTEENDLSDYIFSCKEGAEAFTDNTQPKIIMLIREIGVKLPAPKQEMMKIGTRIFKKKAPERTYIFLEAKGTQENANILGAIQDFLKKIGEVPENAPPPKWISEYIYEESTNEKNEIQKN